MQLALPVSLPVDQTFDSFYGENDLGIVEHLMKLCVPQTNIETPVTLLCGRTGTGKSHLLFGGCHMADKNNITNVYLNLDDPNSLDPLMLFELETHRLICLDNIDKIEGALSWETALFDLINRVIEQRNLGHKSHLVMSLSDLPNHRNFILPDLLSRLNWGTTFKLKEPNDLQRKEVLKLRAKLQGLELNDTVCSFLMSRSDRHLPALLALLDKLDLMSLQSQRKITVPLLKKVLS